MISLATRRGRFSVLSIAAWAIVVLILYHVFISSNGGTTAGLISSFSPDREFSSGPGKNGERYAPIYVNKMPKGSPKSLPKLQVSFPPESETAKVERRKRQAAVKERFEVSWKSYRERAFGADELRPISGQPETSSFGGWGATLVDSLDALWIMGMREEFEAAAQRAASINFNHTQSSEINVFETAIRYMGGLIGAYDISGAQYPVLLQKAVEIGDMIYRAFDTPNRMPITRWKWSNDNGGGAGADPNQKASTFSLLAEIGSFTLEFTRLSQLTGDGKYYDAVYRVAKIMDQNQGKTRISGLWPIIVDADELKFDFYTFGLGGMADSAFEYLPKMTAMIGGREGMYQRMYERAIDAARRYLFYRPMLPGNPDILVSGSAQSAHGVIHLEPQGQHLTCFVGGMVLMGAKLYGRKEELALGNKLTDGCIWAYDSMPSGIMPEVFQMVPCGGIDRSGKPSINIADASCPYTEEAWIQELLNVHEVNEKTISMSDGDRAQYILTTERLQPGYVKYNDRKYMLRPEAIESVFYSYRMTGDSKYQEAAWRMWLAIDKNTRTELAHAGIKDVTTDHPEKDDKMESFWLAETLKYFYLIFSNPEHVSLDRYVLNTEAHTFLRPGATWQEDI